MQIKKYYTKKFRDYSEETIADWLNSFEEKRNGRPNCEYYITIIDKSQIGKDFCLTIEVMSFVNND